MSSGCVSWASERPLGLTSSPITNTSIGRCSGKSAACASGAHKTRPRAPAPTTTRRMDPDFSGESMPRVAVLHARRGNTRISGRSQGHPRRAPLRRGVVEELAVEPLEVRLHGARDAGDDARARPRPRRRARRSPRVHVSRSAVARQRHHELAGRPAPVISGCSSPTDTFSGYTLAP